MLSDIQQQIAEYEQAYHREPHAVSLLAVSKGRSISQIEILYAQGQRAFAESYVQEALPKIEALQGREIEWHFIGPIQTNKTRKVAEHFAWVQSVDSFKVAKRLNDQRPLTLAPLNICIQVNMDNEPTKSGIAADLVLTLVKQCQSLPRLKLRGLMMIPPPAKDCITQQKIFTRCFQLWQMCIAEGVAFDTLSMGMSQDFRAAIASGSTLVRIGSALF